MKCPYCNKDMKLGYFHNASQPIQWLPRGSAPSVFRFDAAENGGELKNSFSLGGYKAEAYYCPSCEIVISEAK